MEVKGPERRTFINELVQEGKLVSVEIEAAQDRWPVAYRGGFDS